MEDETSHEREEIGQPHTTIRELGRRVTGRPEASEEPVVALTQRPRVDFEGFLVVVADLGALRQSALVHEAAIGEEHQLVVSGQGRCRRSHVPPVALDVSPIQRADERLPELAVASGLLGDEENAAHRSTLGRAGEPTSVTPAGTSARTTAPAPTTASLPTVRPGTRTAPAPMKAPASTVTLPARTAPGER